MIAVETAAAIGAAADAGAAEVAAVVADGREEHLLRAAETCLPLNMPHRRVVNAIRVAVTNNAAIAVVLISVVRAAILAAAGPKAAVSVRRALRQVQLVQWKMKFFFRANRSQNSATARQLPHP